MPPALPSDYPRFLNDLKARIRQAQIQAIVSVNQELIQLYWDIGREILHRQTSEGWGSKVIARLSMDLRNAFPDLKGFSRTNLLYMRAFAEAYQEPIVQQPVGRLPWGHNVMLIDKVKPHDQRIWYAQAALEHGWSRTILALQIENRLHERQVQAAKTTNFPDRLPGPQSELAEQALKDPYIFDFLSLGPQALERDLEHGLIGHITKFLLELGAGFSFVGQQVHLEVGKDDFYLDLLFYHLKLRCFVVIDLKTKAFKPEFAGKMNFYLSAVDGLLRHPHDAPSIGLILCKDRNRFVAEYALKDINKPIGVAEWQTKLVDSLPAEFQGILPTVEELEVGLSTQDIEAETSCHD